MSADFLSIGLHYGVKASVYHADPCEQPSLSSTVARTIIEKSIEHAHSEHPRLGGNKRESTPAMDLGSVVHALMEGDGEHIGGDYVLGDFDSYRSKDAQAWRAGIEAAGGIPVLERDLEAARPIAASLRAHAADGCTNSPFASHGKSEVTAIWREGDVFCRARYDRLVLDPTGFADIWDWKKTSSVSDFAISCAVRDYGYHIQAAFYIRGLIACLPEYRGRVSFTFGFVEEKAPHAVRRVCLTPTYLQKGDREASRAIAEWGAALSQNRWYDLRSFETMQLDMPAYMEDDEISIS